MNRKAKVTFTLPPDVYAVGDQIAEKNNTTLSGWVWAQIRVKAREELGVDIDNPTPEQKEIIAKWMLQQTTKKRRHAAKKAGKGVKRGKHTK
jgi:hypothetical protein